MFATLVSPAPASSAADAMRYRVTVEQRVKDYGGKVTNAPALRIDTAISGSNSRAEVVSGGKEIKTGDVLLTNDGGATIYWIRKRSYQVMDDAYRARITREVADKMKVSIRDGRVSTGERGGQETIAGFKTSHGRVTRTFNLGVRVLLLSVNVDYEDHLDVWTAPELDGVPSIEAAFYETFINMVPFADDELRSQTDDAARQLPKGFPLKWSHEAVTRKDDGSTEEKSTVFTVSEVTRGADAAGGVSFTLPDGLKRVEKF